MSLKDKIKNQLRSTSRPKDYPLEFDICMKCGRRMSDNMYSTWKEHCEKVHPLSKNEKRKLLFSKHPVLITTVILFGIVILLQSNPLQAFIESNTYILSKQMDPNVDILSPEELNACGDEIFKFKQELYATKAFTVNDINTLNHLTKDCNLRLLVWDTGPNVFDDKRLEVAELQDSKP